MTTSRLIAAAAAFFFAFAAPIAPADDDAKPLDERQVERLNQRNKRKAQEAWARDKKERDKKEFAEMETDYQEINEKYREPEIKEIIERFIKKYKDGNRVGCATLYLAQKSGGSERETLLKKAISDFSDSYYLDGCCVGGLARLYLAGHYQRSGDDAKAKELVAEIEKDYAEAQDHRGKPIIDLLAELKK